MPSLASVGGWYVPFWDVLVGLFAEGVAARRHAECCLPQRYRGVWGGPWRMDVDKQEQYEQIAPMILSNETLHAVYDCKGAGTGFVGITDKRLIFYDRAMLRKKKSLVSVPFRQITSVSSVDEGRGLFGSSSDLIIRAGMHEFEFEFRGGDKAQRAYKLIMTELLQNEP
ncbi:MAG: hypothetical protein DLM71_06435 [Chloroflexi bacterium]|nr:MAG: hypothetical protein DLM71_06435 [Chloroflexota bacterium]